MKFQFMPMFWGDLLANTLDLSAEEAGAYLFLIAHAWEHKATVPRERAQRIARISNFRWQKVCPRMQQFFNTSKDPNNWIHERVLSELTKAAEISNKRKGAAEQMHSKRTSNSSANAHANTPPSTTTATTERSTTSVREEEEPADRKTETAEPEQAVADKKPHTDFRDPGNDYRSPPKTKSDNVLTPIPERPTLNGSGFRRP